jgi:hypothetical protein
MQKITIDDIGIKVSNDFAESQKMRDERYLDIRSVGKRSQLDRNMPISTLESDLVLQTNIRNHPYASLSAPPSYSDMTNRAFLHTLIPSVGGKDNIENEINRLQDYISKLKEELSKVKEAQEINFIENEIIGAQNIIQLLQLLLDFTLALEQIEGVRRKNQKG